MGDEVQTSSEPHRNLIGSKSVAGDRYGRLGRPQEKPQPNLIGPQASRKTVAGKRYGRSASANAIANSSGNASASLNLIQKFSAEICHIAERGLHSACKHGKDVRWICDFRGVRRKLFLACSL